MPGDVLPASVALTGGTPDPTAVPPPSCLVITPSATSFILTKAITSSHTPVVRDTWMSLHGKHLTQENKTSMEKRKKPLY